MTTEPNCFEYPEFARYARKMFQWDFWYNLTLIGRIVCWTIGLPVMIGILIPLLLVSFFSILRKNR